MSQFILVHTWENLEHLGCLRLSDLKGRDDFAFLQKAADALFFGMPLYALWVADDFHTWCDLAIQAGQTQFPGTRLFHFLQAVLPRAEGVALWYGGEPEQVPAAANGNDLLQAIQCQLYQPPFQVYAGWALRTAVSKAEPGRGACNVWTDAHSDNPPAGGLRHTAIAFYLALLDSMQAGDRICLRLGEARPLPSLLVECATGGQFCCTLTNEARPYCLVEDILGQASFLCYTEEPLPPDKLLLTKKAARGAVQRFFAYSGDINRCIEWID